MLVMVLVSGCTSLAPAVELLAGRYQHAAASQVAAGSQALAAPTAQATTLRVGQPASITIAPGADVETEINEAVYQKVNASVVYIENLASLARTRFGIERGRARKLRLGLGVGHAGAHRDE